MSYSESSTSDDVFYFDMPASDVTVRAYFTDGVYEISTDIDGSGRLTITGEDGNVTDVAEEGEEIRITASANNNYRLGDLYVTYTDSDDETRSSNPEVEYKNNGQRRLLLVRDARVRRGDLRRLRRGRLRRLDRPQRHEEWHHPRQPQRGRRGRHRQHLRHARHGLSAGRAHR